MTFRTIPSFHPFAFTFTFTFTFAVALALAFATLSAIGCGGGSGSQTCSGSTAVVANEANDYMFSSTLVFPPIAVAPNTELTFDWSGVTADFERHTLNPQTDINTVLVVLWDLTLEQIQTEVNADMVLQRDSGAFASFTTNGATSAKLFDFTIAGNPVTPDMILPYFDPVMQPPASHIYTLMPSTGTILGQGTRMIQSFRLDPASTNTMVKATKDSTTLTFTANLHSLKPTLITAGKPGVTLDWSQMTTNALGNDFVHNSITEALVSHYTQTPTQLEGDAFLNLDTIATELYRGNIDSGFVADFSLLKNAQGQTFPGIDATGTWLVALRCGGCRNPAPWYLTVLKPCGG